VFNYEEYESIRLSDFELMGQVEAAKVMEISRPTFARIYESARRKIAQAFVNGSPIVFEGGKVYFNSEWYTCKSCGCLFNHPQKDQEVVCCALCGSSHIEQYSENEYKAKDKDIFICLQCGKKRNDAPSNCSEVTCPDCNTPMTRNGILI
jgi:DNA-directed RNA polymerase subunit RPC12/RpoP